MAPWTTIFHADFYFYLKTLFTGFIYRISYRNKDFFYTYFFLLAFFCHQIEYSNVSLFLASQRANLYHGHKEVTMHHP